MFTDTRRINPVERFLDYRTNVDKEMNPDVINDETVVQLSEHPRESDGSTIFFFPILFLGSSTTLV